MLDAGKAIAVLLANDGEPLDYLEVIGRSTVMSGRLLPLHRDSDDFRYGRRSHSQRGAGTPEHHVKVSLRSPLMLPRLAIVDPELTCRCGPSPPVRVSILST